VANLGKLGALGAQLREMPDLSEVPPANIYFAGLEEIEGAIDAANQRFVAARLLIEQYGSRPVFERRKSGVRI